MNGIMPLAHVTARSWIEALDPRLKLLWLVWISSLSLLLDSAAALLVLAILAALGSLGLRLSGTALLSLKGLLAALVWGTLLSQGLFYAVYPRTVLFTIVPPFSIGETTFDGLHFYREGALYGAVQSLRMLAVTLAGLSVCLSTSPERLLAALTRMRVPVAVSFMTVTALRFLPLLLQELATARMARRLRGYRSGLHGLGLPRPSSWWRAARMELRLLVPVMASLLRRAGALAESVTSRGFDPSARRTFYPVLSMSMTQRLICLGLIVAWLAVAGAKLLYWCYVAQLYYDPALRGLYDLVRRYL
jgi:energy-coupling factor transport system permease protein